MAAEWGEGENSGGGWRTKKTKEIIAQKHKRAPMKLSTSAMWALNDVMTQKGSFLDSFYGQFGSPSWENSKRNADENQT